MINLVKFSDFLNSSDEVNEAYSPGYTPEWKDGGLVLIKGIPLKDGKPRLYGAKLKRIIKDDRGNFFRAILYPELYIIRKNESGNYVAPRVDINDNTLKKSVGISGFNVALNSKSGKTPMWKTSVTETSFPRFLNDWRSSLDSWDEFNY
jgi:hypothetical protein